MVISFARASALAAAFLGVAYASPSAAAASRYDGQWSVLVITDSGTCDRGYRYQLRVQNGRVYYDGEAGIDVNGRVGNDGRLRVSIRRGSQGASGTGRLSGDAGSGLWQGQSATDKCGGRWQAERRARN